MCDEDHRTPLMEACENNHMETVLYLLRAGASATHKVRMHLVSPRYHRLSSARYTDEENQNVVLPFDFLPEFILFKMFDRFLCKDLWLPELTN